MGHFCEFTGSAGHQQRSRLIVSLNIITYTTGRMLLVAGKTTDTHLLLL